MLPSSLDKSRILAAVCAQLERDHEALLESQRVTQRGATHEEARPENDKDTRALEATYLARGLAERVTAMGEARHALALFQLRDFSGADPVALGALVSLESEDGELRHYLLLPEAGGLRVEVDGVEVTCLSPRAPLGRALLGTHLDDEVELDSPQGRRVLGLVALR